jgi:hypothetical protein
MECLFGERGPGHCQVRSSFCTGVFDVLISGKGGTVKKMVIKVLPTKTRTRLLSHTKWG